MSRIDQVVGRIGEEGNAAFGCRPACLWITQRDPACCRPRACLIIQRCKIFAHGTGADFRIVPIEVVTRLNAVLMTGVGSNQAGIDCEPFTLYQASRHTTADHFVEHPAEDTALPEAAMSILGEGGMVRNCVFQS